MYLHIIALLFSLFGFGSPNLQNRAVPVYTFNEFEALLNKQTDTLYVINFWATWCRPCVQELPDFDNLETDFKGKKIKVMLVSLDDIDNLNTVLLPFIERKKIKSEIVLLNAPNANEWIDKVDSSWSGSIPATVIYSKTDRSFYERTFTREELHQTISNHLKTKK